MKNAKFYLTYNYPNLETTDQVVVCSSPGVRIMEQKEGAMMCIVKQLLVDVGLFSSSN